VFKHFEAGEGALREVADLLQEIKGRGKLTHFILANRKKLSSTESLVWFVLVLVLPLWMTVARIGRGDEQVAGSWPPSEIVLWCFSIPIVMTWYAALWVRLAAIILLLAAAAWRYARGW
jgi:hypothetical protein